MINVANEIRSVFGDQLWPGFGDVSFPVLLIADSLEYLFDHPDPPAGFNTVSLPGYSGVVYTRDRVLPKRAMASFPLKGIKIAAMGTLNNIKIPEYEWVLAILHESFHVYQTEHKPDHYSEKVSKINIAPFDNLGDWTFKHKFPYSEEWVQRNFNQYVKALLNALEGIEHKGSLSDVDSTNLIRQRRGFFSELNEHNRVYAKYQIWKEGIARYTEYKIAQLISIQPDSSLKFPFNNRSGPDQLERIVYDREVSKLKDMVLDSEKREVFYSIGFAEGLILDLIKPKWRKEYLKPMFSVIDHSN